VRCDMATCRGKGASGAIWMHGEVDERTRPRKAEVVTSVLD
jgi:hypothetical protein